MAEDIEKFDDNAFVNKEGDILSADDARIQEDIDPKSMRSSRERANQMMRASDPGPTDEDVEIADALFDKAKVRPEPTQGASNIFRDYVRDLHTAMDYASAHAKAVALDKALSSDNDNSLKHRHDGETIAAQSASKAEGLKPDYRAAITHLARTAELLEAGFTMKDLVEARATSDDMEEDFMEAYGPGNAPKKGRWYAIDKMEKSLGMAPRPKKKINRKPKPAAVIPAQAPIEQKDEPLMTVEDEERLLPPVAPTPVFEREQLDTTGLSVAAMKHVDIIASAIATANQNNTFLNINGARSVGEYLAVDLWKDKDITTADVNQLLRVYNIT